MMFPQYSDFTYIPETTDDYGTITEGTPVSCKGYIEPDVTFNADGAIIARGKIYTTDLTDFKVDSKLTIFGIDYYLKNIAYFTVLNYNYHELSYV